MAKRLIVSVVAGAALGVLCIVGAQVRAGGIAGNELFLAAMWYNRVLMGLVIGLAGSWQIVGGPANRYVRGALLGLLVSGAFYVSSGLRDPIAFTVGIVYGIAIEFAARRA
jgi:hypothetical protein